MASIQTTDNGTLVRDAEIENAPMAVVYRGLGPETGTDYAYDTAEWMMKQIDDSLSDDLLKKIVFVVPDDYTQDCETCIQQSTKKIKAKITGFSICGFSKGGAPLYQNIKLRAWKVLGLIDPVSPSMEGRDDQMLDKFAPHIRCVYGVWGDKPKEEKPWESYTKKEKLYIKKTKFHQHLKDLKGVQMAYSDRNHKEMPSLFFSKYGSALA